MKEKFEVSGLNEMNPNELLSINGGGFWKVVTYVTLANPLIAYNYIALAAAGAAVYQGYQAGYDMIK